MMKSIYDNMWNNAYRAFENDELEFDPLIDDLNDSRRGITLQAKPGRKLHDNFSKFLEEARSIEPEQYIYKPDEIHITILSIINCSKEFSLPEINLPAYISYIDNSIKNIKPIEIEFRGLTASSSCILIQGFPENNLLELLRNNLRTEFKKGNLYNSIDKRYKINTAHCTVIRFKKEFKARQKFIGFLENYRDYYFGKTSIFELELVNTDWYHKKDIVQVLQKFKLLSNDKQSQ